jgi:four helix bundle protein
MAQASLSEIDTQVEIALQLGYMSEETYGGVEKKLVDVQMLLSGLSRSIAH